MNVLWEFVRNANLPQDVQMIHGQGNFGFSGPRKPFSKIRGKNWLGLKGPTVVSKM